MVMPLVMVLLRVGQENGAKRALESIAPHASCHLAHSNTTVSTILGRAFVSLHFARGQPVNTGLKLDQLAARK